MNRTEELIALAQKGDKTASEALVEENNGLIWAVARRFQGRGTEMDDLYQLGCLGFLKAVDGFDPASLLPDLGSVLGIVATVCRFAVLIGPIILLLLGIAYLLFAPKEANYHFGYRCYYGMGSVEAWRFTQRLAGILWSVLGLVLTAAMVLLTNGFAEMDVYDAVWTAVKYVLWEVGLAALSCIVINTMVMIRFTYSGD